MTDKTPTQRFDGIKLDERGAGGLLHDYCELARQLAAELEAAQRALACAYEECARICEEMARAEFATQRHDRTDRAMAACAAAIRNAGEQAQVNAGEKRQAQANGPDTSLTSPAPDALVEEIARDIGGCWDSDWRVRDSIRCAILEWERRKAK